MKQIWIVDDDEALRKLTEQLLAEFRYEVKTFASGNEALSALAHVTPNEAPSLIISDLEMSDGSGEDLLRGLRELQGVRHIPVLLISGHERLSEIRGFDAVLRKPFTEDELLPLLANLLKS